MALGHEGLTAAKFDANVRALRGTIMSVPSTNTSSESDYFVGLPTGSNVVPTGVLMQDVCEPGYPLTSETLPVSDPTLGTVTGSTPAAPFVSGGGSSNGVYRAWALCTGADDVEAIAADTTFGPGDFVMIADAYGRITKIGASTTTVYHAVGRAKYAAGAANQRVRISYRPQDVYGE